MVFLEMLLKKLRLKMCLESCFDCQEPCWDTNCQPEVSISGLPEDESKNCVISSGLSCQLMTEPQPARVLLQGQHEKQARRETDMGYQPSGMLGADYKKPWYAVSD